MGWELKNVSKLGPGQHSSRPCDLTRMVVNQIPDAAIAWKKKRRFDRGYILDILRGKSVQTVLRLENAINMFR